MPPLDQLPAAYLALSERYDETLHEVAQLKLQLAWLQKKLFGGVQSERLDKQQLLLAMSEQEAAAEPEVETEQVNYERRKPTGEKRPVAAAVFAQLPVRETVTIEPEEVQAAPEAYERIGEERTFEVDVTPPQVFKREIIRPKYRVKADRALPPVVAPAPQKPVMGGYASAGLLAWVAISKYLDHLPLYRQEKMLARWGAPISRQTMNDWIRITAEWLEPVYRTMRERVLAEAYVQVDETPVRCHDPDEKRGRTSQGYLWVMSHPGGDVVFDWRLSRRHGELTSLIEGFKGVLQADGYEAYAAHARAHPEVTLVGCWAHARRKFIEAQGEHPRLAKGVLRLIGRLYRWEHLWDEADEASGCGFKAEERERLRRAHYPPVLRALRTVALRWRSRLLPRSGLGKACGYLLGQWDVLAAHGERGETKLDNNLVENAIRPSAVGKKNWLFVGQPDAGERAGILYSIIVSCQRHGKDPLAYLRDVLDRLPRMTNQQDLTPLTPRHWQPPLVVHVDADV